MAGPLAVAAVPEGAVLVAASAAAATGLLSAQPRRRAWAMLGALVLAAAALAPLVADDVADRVKLAAAGAGAGAVAVAALAFLFHRRPDAFALLALLALPFRVPVTVGATTASLLLPLYGVIAAGCVAYAARRLRTWEDDPPGDPRVARLAWVLAAVLVLYAVQSVYSDDVEQAAKNVCFFYVPFAVLFRLLLEVPWERRLLLASFGLVTGLALLFALVGMGEWATGRLLLVNEKVLAANELKPYFRVNSLFFDPNVYGRFLALSMLLLATVLLWGRRARDAWLIAVALAVLWAGLVLSLSQSSFAALLAGLLALTALRWRPLPVLGGTAVAIAAAVAVVVFAPGAVGLKSDSETALDRATSGRASLVRGGVDMARARPVWGYGSGGFAATYRKREHVRSPTRVVVSHTIPLTVAAEQGAVGLLAYLALLWAALTMLFAGLRARLREPDVHAIARAAVAAAFCALVVHTLVYAAYLEDPLAWTLLAAGAALRLRRDEAAPDAPAPGRAAAAPAHAAP